MSESESGKENSQIESIGVDEEWERMLRAYVKKCGMHLSDGLVSVKKKLTLDDAEFILLHKKEFADLLEKIEDERQKKNAQKIQKEILSDFAKRLDKGEEFTTEEQNFIWLHIGEFLDILRKVQRENRKGEGVKKMENEEKSENKAKSGVVHKAQVAVKEARK